MVWIFYFPDLSGINFEYVNYVGNILSSIILNFKGIMSSIKFIISERVIT